MSLASQALRYKPRTAEGDPGAPRRAPRAADLPSHSQHPPSPPSLHLGLHRAFPLALHIIHWDSTSQPLQTLFFPSTTSLDHCSTLDNTASGCNCFHSTPGNQPHPHPHPRALTTTPPSWYATATTTATAGSDYHRLLCHSSISTSSTPSTGPCHRTLVLILSSIDSSTLLQPELACASLHKQNPITMTFLCPLFI